MWVEAIRDIELIYVGTFIVVGLLTVKFINLCADWCNELNATIPPHQQELRRLNAEH